MKKVKIALIGLFWAVFLVTFVNRCFGISMLTLAGPWIIMISLVVSGLLTLLISEL